MPSRNIEKIYVSEAYYHIYNRGVAKQVIFEDDQDYSVFLSLLKRYLCQEPARDKQGREYPNYHEGIELLAFCLMPNHYHMLVYQSDPQAMTKLLRGVCTAYTMYFNKKYQRVGHLFQGRFKASMITNDAYLQHISRYIHLNPENYDKWEFSSLAYYLGAKHTDWLVPNKILELFKVGGYKTFVSDYEEHRAMLKILKNELANA